MSTSVDNSVLIQEDLWAAYVAQHGLGRARALLCEIKGDLRTQRRARQLVGKPTPEEAREHAEWVKGQARFEGLVNRRLSEVEQALAERPPVDHKAALGEALNLVRVLALALDNTEKEHLLDEHNVTIKGETMTLAEAIDDGVFN